MTFIYSRVAGAVNQNTAFTRHGALVGKRDVNARCPGGWICSGDFTDDDHLFSANGPTRSTHQFAAALKQNGNGLVFQKDVDGAWQFSRSNPPAGATRPVAGSDRHSGDTGPHLDSGTVILIETGARPLADGVA